MEPSGSKAWHVQSISDCGNIGSCPDLILVICAQQTIVGERFFMVLPACETIHGPYRLKAS